MPKPIPTVPGKPNVYIIPGTTLMKFWKKKPRSRKRPKKNKATNQQGVRDIPIPTPSLSSNKTPLQEQESVIDLTDDLAPNTADLQLSATGQALASQQGNPGTEDKRTAQDVLMNKGQTQSESSGGEIKWELNTLDDEQIGSGASTIQPEAPKAAFKIKLNIQSKQKPSTSTALHVPKIQLSTLKKVKPIIAPTFVERPKQVKIPKMLPTFVNNLKPVSSTKPVVQPASTATGYTQPSFIRYMPKATAKAAGIPRSFLAHQTSQGELGAIQPQPVTGSENLPPTLKPVPVVNSSANAIPRLDAPQPLQLDTNVETPVDMPQQYSPSDIYNDSGRMEQDPNEGLESPESEACRKRLSAFERLGPQPLFKKPKLTINLTCSKEQSIREVVEPKEAVPVHLREDIIDSKDEMIMRYLPNWPWKKGIVPRKTVTARTSKSAMLLEQEQMEEYYDRDSAFVQVSVRGYPPTWRKEDVLDALLDAIKGKSFIPCFIEFTKEECKFLVIRSRPALTVIHKIGFYVTKDDVQLQVLIHKIDFTLNQQDFLPRLILRKRLTKGYDSERRLDLKAFTLQPDVSHFIYFPLNRAFNQMEIVQLQSEVAWDYITDLDLSHNRLTTVDGFDLPKMTPRLKNLDVSYNCLVRATALLRCQGLSLKTLRLEGNPLCHDYIDPDHYVRVLRMMFPSLTEIDGIPVKLKGDMPHRVNQNYCPDDAKEVVDKFLEVFFPMLDSPPDERSMIEHLYDDKATLTITYKYRTRYSMNQRYFRNFFSGARVMDRGETDAIEGASSIAKIIYKWPCTQHDPLTFTVDVMHHSETSTIFRVSGILKLTVETLAEDEHLIAFTRTIVLVPDGPEYKILNEMLYWESPCAEYAQSAFKLNLITNVKRPTLKFESEPDDDLKEKLVQVFMKVTDLDRTKSKRCLKFKEWNFKHSLEYVIKLLKIDNLNVLLQQDNKEITIPK